MEAQPHGHAIAQPLVRLLAGARRDAQGDRHEACPLVRPPLRRQEARPSQLHSTPPQPDPSQGPAAAEDQAAQAINEGCVRRSGAAEEAEDGAGEILAGENRMTPKRSLIVFATMFAALQTLPAAAAQSL